MVEHHPDRETLELFSYGDLPPDEARWLEEHLRSGCAVCQRIVDDLLASFIPSPDTGAVLSGNPAHNWIDEEVWKRIFSQLEQRLALITLERKAAPCLVEDLLLRPPAERRVLTRTRSRYQTLAVCEQLIERSFGEGFQNPALSIELAELAVELADRLDDGCYGRAIVQDLRARAWAYLGNARRLSSDLTGAEQALAHAEALSENGSADPLEEARILDLKASLLSDQGWFESAAEMLDLAIDIYEEIRDPHRKGRALISKGLFLSYAGQPEKTVELIHQGLSLIDGGEEPRLELMARHALALADCGRPEEARQQLEGTDPKDEKGSTDTKDLGIG